MTDFNTTITDEFRSGAARPGDMFDAEKLLILHTVGARSGEPRESPLAFFRDGDHIVIVASAAGAPSHPAWFHNLVAQPEVTVELRRGTDITTVAATASVATGKDRTKLWNKVIAAAPGFADYETKTTRTIPVIVLEPHGRHQA